VESIDFVCPRCKKKTAWAINAKLYTLSAAHILYDRSACVAWLLLAAVAVVLLLRAWDCTSYDCFGF